MDARNPEEFSLLTGQEKKVLERVARARTNKEIAAALGISLSTVKRHLEHIMKKLHVKNRVEAAVYAVTKGDCPLDVGGEKRVA